VTGRDVKKDVPLIPNHSVLEQLEEKLRLVLADPGEMVVVIIQTRRLPIFGHIARMDDDADAKMILTAPPPEN